MIGLTSFLPQPTIVSIVIAVVTVRNPDITNFLKGVINLFLSFFE